MRQLLATTSMQCSTAPAGALNPRCHAHHTTLMGWCTPCVDSFCAHQPLVQAEARCTASHQQLFAAGRLESCECIELVGVVWAVDVTRLLRQQPEQQLSTYSHVPIATAWALLGSPLPPPHTLSSSHRHHWCRINRSPQVPQAAGRGQPHPVAGPQGHAEAGGQWRTQQHSLQVPVTAPPPPRLDHNKCSCLQHDCTLYAWYASCIM